jgi:Rad3-related DNA helicase
MLTDVAEVLKPEGEDLKFDRALIDEYFPFDEFRDGQRGCLEFILDAFEDGKKCVIVEAPTGSGKSAIGLAVSRFFDSVYYLTIQKILQSQIINDFGDFGDIVDLKGRATYPCTFYDRHDVKSVSAADLAKIHRDGVDCNHGFCRKKEQRYKSPRCFPASNGSGDLSSLPDGMQYSACLYYEQVFSAVNSHTCLMNFSSFLYQTHMSKRFGPRGLMIIDEAHQMEPQLLNFISISLNDKRLQHYGIELEEYQTPEEYWIYFVESDIISKILTLIDDVKDAEDIRAQDEYSSLAKKLGTFMHCMEREEEWVAEFERGKDFNTVQLKPVFVDSKSDSYILDFGRRCLMMSATILDVGIFCSSLGIARSDTAAFRMKNRFPVNNRPIYIRSAGSLAGGKKKMPEWGPRLLKKVDEVISEHPDDRGIIHTHNFAIADLLMSKSDHRDRFLFQNMFSSKEDMLKVHADTQKSVIVAPAMHEGIDLVDDLSRFQIICKIPWANFYTDKQLARRVELDTNYYVWLTALKLVQSYGRSIRSETDFADTYVIDGGFDSFMSRAGNMIPSWFRDAVQMG